VQPIPTLHTIMYTTNFIKFWLHFNYYCWRYVDVPYQYYTVSAHPITTKYHNDRYIPCW